MQVQKVTDAVKLVKEARPDLMVEGPLQYDAAIDPTVAAVKIKMPSEVAGRATVFIFPDLNTGNNTYKAVQQVGVFGTPSYLAGTLIVL
jgi:phosphotransacetylase